MTSRSASIAVATLLLIVAGQQQAFRAASGSATALLPSRLRDTGLYAPGSGDSIAAENRPFSPQYPLWSDSAVKRRWVHLPAGTTIYASNPRQWEFPIGTKLWKEFSFGERRVETRFLWRTPGGWAAASYAWNRAGTDALLASEDGVRGATEIVPGRQHNIPSRADCAACHGSALRPLGFNPLQLSTDRDPNAIHGEALTAEMLTLETLFAERLIRGADPALRRTPPRIAAADPQTRSVLGYLSTNCGACHNGDGQITAQVPSLFYADLMSDTTAATRGLVGQPSKWQAPGTSDGTLLVDPGSPHTSAMVLRMKSRRPSTQMPPLGTVVADMSAVDAISRWIGGIH